MAKFVWQDGTLVSKAKVEIGGTIYEVDSEEYSGSTPLSASNLNAMVDQTYQDLKDYADEKDTKIATAYLSSVVENVGQRYLLMNMINSNSDRLTLSSGGILIGSGISKIKISGNVFGVSNDNSGYLWCYITKTRGTTNTNESIAIDNTNTLFGSVSFSPKLINVQEGDLIRLFKEDGSTTSIRGAGNTWLTVEVVE